MNASYDIATEKTQSVFERRARRGELPTPELNEANRRRQLLPGGALEGSALPTRTFNPGAPIHLPDYVGLQARPSRVVHAADVRKTTKRRQDESRGETSPERSVTR